MKVGPALIGHCSGSLPAICPRGRGLPRMVGLLLIIVIFSVGIERHSRSADAAPIGSQLPARDGAGNRFTFIGKAVDFNLSGLEPDFDPIYKVVVTGRLHDRGTASRALPD